MVKRSDRASCHTLEISHKSTLSVDEFLSQNFRILFQRTWHAWYHWVIPAVTPRQMASSRLINPRVWSRSEHYETLSGGRRLETWRMAISCEAFCLADWNNDLAVSVFFRIISVPRSVPHIAYWCSRIGVKVAEHGSPIMARIKPLGPAAFDCTRLERPVLSLFLQKRADLINDWDECRSFEVALNVSLWLGPVLGRRILYD